MVVTATKIKLNGFIGFLRFVIRIRNITKQLNAADGLIFVKFQGFRTLTGWKNLEAMKAFRGNGSHLDAMKSIRNIGKAKSITWETQFEPDWHEANEKLKDI